jgi:hypothetical protein
MNLWRAWAPGPTDASRRVIWSTSERDCRTLAKNDFGADYNPVNVKSLEIPTTKPELVKWLNDNVNHIAI